MSKSTSESALIPQEAYKKGVKRVFRYNGPSMEPTFQTGQLLYVRPDVQDVKPGDVVVFEQEGRTIVHRVLSVGKNGYITRGDNNQAADSDPVTPDQLIGRVEMNAYGNTSTLVRGGWRGLWLARLGPTARRLEAGLRLVFGWPYRLLKASMIMVKIWKPEISQIHLTTDTGIIIKYVHNQKTVAVWQASQGHFECRKPFDLVIFHPEEK